MIKILGPKSPKQSNVINVTTSSKTLYRSLSPMLLGPVLIPGRGLCKNVENAWQYSKVYTEHLNDKKDPNSSWFEWSSKGYNTNYGIRYPYKKSVKPEYSYWNNEKLFYVEARKKIYLQIYSEAARKTIAYKCLQQEYSRMENLILWDFDGYNYTSMNKTLEECLEDPSRPFGHAFVLAMMLQNKL